MSKPQKEIILVTGATGQLGRALLKITNHHGSFKVIATDRSFLDITDAYAVQNIFKRYAPKYCINCAAYTAVDRAEEQKTLSYQVNDQAVGHLIKGCAHHKTKLIHISTDYVYDSISDRPILESDPCTPRSIYGQSKRAGEQRLEISDIDWINFRVSWLYAPWQNNFVRTMLRLGRAREELDIVGDQVGSPTYASDVAQVIINLIDLKDRAIYRQHYNYSNSGPTTWAGFAREIFDQSGIHCQVRDITTEDFGAPAPRPAWSVLSKDKISAWIKDPIRSWRDALSDCLQQMED